MIRLALCCLVLAWCAPVVAGTTTPSFEPAPCAFRDVPVDWATQHRVGCGWLHVPESRGATGSRMLRL